MTSSNHPTRRAVTFALAGLSLAGNSTSATGGERRVSSRTLVAYFSRTGNTRVVAGLIQRTLDADVFEIQPATPYPEEYLSTVEQARQERDSDFEPTLKARVSNIASYDTVFLGFPIWGETTPPVIRSFLSAHDLSGKILIPFVTHGGYGLGNSNAVVTNHAPRARLRQGFSMQSDQERHTMNLVNDWMKSVNVVR